MCPFLSDSKVPINTGRWHKDPVHSFGQGLLFTAVTLKQIKSKPEVTLAALYISADVLWASVCMLTASICFLRQFRTKHLQKILLLFGSTSWPKGDEQSYYDSSSGEY